MTIARLPVRRSTTISPRSGIAVASIRWCDGVTVAGSISVELALQRERRVWDAPAPLPSSGHGVPLARPPGPPQVGSLCPGRDAPERRVDDPRSADGRPPPPV